MVINGELLTNFGKTITPRPYIYAYTSSSVQYISSQWTKVEFSTYYQVGDIFSLDTTNNVIVIPQGVKRIRIWGSVGGHNKAWVKIGVESSASALNTNNNTTIQVLNQAAGNGYWGSAIPIGELDVNAQTGNKYISLRAYGYDGDTFGLNNGLSATTNICVELLELY